KDDSGNQDRTHCKADQEDDVERVQTKTDEGHAAIVSRSTAAVVGFGLDISKVFALLIVWPMWRPDERRMWTATSLSTSPVSTAAPACGWSLRSFTTPAACRPCMRSRRPKP